MSPSASPNANEAPTITTVAASPTQAAAAQSEIVLHVSGDQYQGSPLMRVSVDGVVVGTYAVTADHHAGGRRTSALPRFRRGWARCGQGRVHQ